MEVLLPFNVNGSPSIERLTMWRQWGVWVGVMAEY